MVRRVQASELAYSVKLQGMETHKQFREVVQVRQTGARGVSQPTLPADGVSYDALRGPLQFSVRRCHRQLRW